MAVVVEICFYGKHGPDFSFVGSPNTVVRTSQQYDLVPENHPIHTSITGGTKVNMHPKSYGYFETK
jgi:hypothetical protein